MDDSAAVADQAWLDFWQGRSTVPLLLHTSYSQQIEKMPIDYFFRNEAEFPLVEQYALSLCQGPVLDVGAGTGVHAYYLEENGVSVTTLEVSAAGVRIQRERGLSSVVHTDYDAYAGYGYATVLLLMNGIGVVGSLAALPGFLKQAGHWLAPSGQLLFDSSDVAYLYEDQELPTNRYYGEVRYRYEYRGQRGAWFPWLYVDFATLATVAQIEGWRAQLIFQNDHDHYLVRMTKE